MVILVRSSTLEIWGLVNWGFGALGIWDYKLLGELGLRESRDRWKRGIETRGIDRTGIVVSVSLRAKILQPNSTSYLRQNIKPKISYLDRNDVFYKPYLGRYVLFPRPDMGISGKTGI